MTKGSHTPFCLVTTSSWNVYKQSVVKILILKSSALLNIYEVIDNIDSLFDVLSASMTEPRF